MSWNRTGQKYFFLKVNIYVYMSYYQFFSNWSEIFILILYINTLEWWTNHALPIFIIKIINNFDIIKITSGYSNIIEPNQNILILSTRFGSVLK